MNMKRRYEEICAGVEVVYHPHLPGKNMDYIAVRITDPKVYDHFCSRYIASTSSDFLDLLNTVEGVLCPCDEEVEELLSLLDDFSEGGLTSSNTFSEIVKTRAEGYGLEHVHATKKVELRSDFILSIFEKGQCCTWNGCVELALLACATEETLEDKFSVLFFKPISMKGVALMDGLFKGIHQPPELKMGEVYSIESSEDDFPLWEALAEAFYESPENLANGTMVPFVDLSTLSL